MMMKRTRRRIWSTRPGSGGRARSVDYAGTTSEPRLRGVSDDIGSGPKPTGHSAFGARQGKCVRDELVEELNVGLVAVGVAGVVAAHGGVPLAFRRCEGMPRRRGGGRARAPRQATAHPRGLPSPPPRRSPLPSVAPAPRSMGGEKGHGRCPERALQGGPRGGLQVA